MPTRPRGAPFTPSFALGHAPIGEEGAAMSDVTPLPAGGPRTHEGKQVVRWNATRHGISSPAPVVPGLERTEDWEKHEEGVLESLRPEGHLETVLAERIALLFWRLHRVTRYETGAIAVAGRAYGSTESDGREDRRGGAGFPRRAGGRHD